VERDFKPRIARCGRGCGTAKQAFYRYFQTLWKSSLNALVVSSYEGIL
jgi:hypothetical protein